MVTDRDELVRVIRPFTIHRPVSAHDIADAVLAHQAGRDNTLRAARRPPSCDPCDDEHDAIWQAACEVIQPWLPGDEETTEEQEAATDLASDIGRALLNAGLLHRHPAAPDPGPDQEDGLREALSDLYDEVQRSLGDRSADAALTAALLSARHVLADPGDYRTIPGYTPPTEDIWNAPAQPGGDQHAEPERLEKRPPKAAPVKAPATATDPVREVLAGIKAVDDAVRPHKHSPQKKTGGDR